MYSQPGPPPKSKRPSLLGIILVGILVLLAIPAIAYGVFLAAVLLSGPVRWN